MKMILNKVLEIWELFCLLGWSLLFYGKYFPERF